MNKFICNNCGECCKNFRSDDHITFTGPYFNSEKTFLLHEKFLTIYDWEEKELANKLSGRKILPATVMFDLKNEQTIVLHYSFDEGECPFHIDSRCQIYSERPMICRQFPCLHNLTPMIKGETNKVVPRDTFCPVDVPLNENTLYFIEERYGEAYYYDLATSILALRKAEFIYKLEKEGKIKLARKGYDPIALLKRIENSKFINFSDYYHSVTGQDIGSIDISAVNSSLHRRSK